MSIVNSPVASAESEDPFNLYPLIINDFANNPKKSTRKKKVKVSSLNQLKDEEVRCNKHVVKETEGANTEGVDRKLKRGRKVQSVAKEIDIGTVSLEGGVILSDSEIEACNQLIIKRTNWGLLRFGSLATRWVF